MESSQGYEGFVSIRDSGVRRGSVDRSWDGVQLVGKYGIEEEVKDNIPSQEKEPSLP